MSASRFRSTIATSLLLVPITLGVISSTSAAPLYAQNIPIQQSELDMVQNRIEKVEDRVSQQLNSISFMIQIATFVFAIVAGTFGVWGVGTYRGLMQNIRDRLETKLGDLQRMQEQLDSKLSHSEALEQEFQKLVRLQEDITPATLLPKAKDLINQNPPNYIQACDLLSQLVRSEGANVDDLYDAARLAKDYLSNRGIAKCLLRKAVEKGGGTYLIDAMLAELSSRGRDWDQHKKTLDQLIRENPSDSILQNMVSNFYGERDDWEGLEEIMAEIETRCNWQAAPVRYRANAAEKLRRSHDEIIAHYERALKKSLPGDATYVWYADYLIRKDHETSIEDIQKAEWLLQRYLSRNPENGSIRLALAKVLDLKGDRQAAIREVKIGIDYIQDPTSKKEGMALLDSWTAGEQITPNFSVTPDLQINPKSLQQVANNSAQRTDEKYG